MVLDPADCINARFASFEVHLPEGMALMKKDHTPVEHGVAFLLQSDRGGPFFCEGLATCFILVDEKTVRVVGPEPAKLSRMEEIDMSVEAWVKWSTLMASNLHYASATLASNPGGKSLRFAKLPQASQATRTGPQ